MKNTIKFLGIIALVAIIGFSFAACGGGDDGGGPGGEGDGGSEGWLTMKNLPSDTSWIQVVVCSGDSPENSGARLGSIQKNEPPFPPQQLIEMGKKPFTGTGTFLLIFTVHTTDYERITKWTMANFTNGNGTVDWNTMTIRGW